MFGGCGGGGCGGVAVAIVVAMVVHLSVVGWVSIALFLFIFVLRVGSFLEVAFIVCGSVLMSAMALLLYIMVFEHC